MCSLSNDFCLKRVSKYTFYYVVIESLNRSHVETYFYDGKIRKCTRAPIRIVDVAS